MEKEYWAYNSTSISSYSETMKQVKYWKNKDGEHLPQINLVLLFGERSGLPFYYRKLVMDRGYYSADNINAMYREHIKFLCGTSSSLKFARDYIREIGAKEDRYEFYNSELELYIFSKTITWDYEQERPYKGDTIKAERRMYLHLYFNPDKFTDDGKAFNHKLDSLKEELLTGKWVPEHERESRKYFEVKETPIRGISLSYKQDVIEKAFWNIKERLNLRTLTSSESSLEGKLFVEFVVLIYLSYIKKKMEEKGLFSSYTMQELLDEPDVIGCFTEPGKALIQGEFWKSRNSYIGF